MHFLGFTSVLARPELIGEGKAPSNYKKPEAIKEYLEGRKERMLRGGSSVPGLASLTSVAIFNDKGEREYYSAKASEEPYGCVSGSLFQHMKERHDVLTYPLYGFRIRTLFNIAITEAIARYGRSITVPRCLLLEPENNLLDPVDLLLPKMAEVVMGLGQTLSFLLDKPVNEEVLYADPLQQAMLAHQLMARAHLYERT